MSRVGFLVDGQAEFRSLAALMRRIQTTDVLLGPLYADIQPFAPVGQIVSTIRSKLPVLASKRIDRAIVLLDRETRNECPGELAGAIVRELAPACSKWGVQSTAVVVKDRTFENWLISDVEALRAMPQRFQIGLGHARSIATGSDRIDALAMMTRIVREESYEKVADAVRILQRANPERMALSSRSFRRFLRVVGHPHYAQQSAAPHLSS